MINVLLEAFCDSINMVPFLLVTYFIIEYIEQRSSDKMDSIMRGFGKFGPLGGALLGCVPQCGFSASASNFYSNKVITMGTLIAVFLSTSDEAIPILISNPSHIRSVFKLLAVKIAVAVLAGFLVDMIFKSNVTEKTHIHKKHCNCCHGDKKISSILWAALRHTLSTYVFIFIVCLALGGGIELLGQDKISSIFMANTWYQPFVAALVGFIPNCASSVLLTQLYIEGTLTFGSVVAGLCTGAGVGLAVLFKENRPMRDNFKIMLITYVVAVIAGLVF